MTIRAYWDRIAENYEKEIFSVIKHDRQDLVVSRIKKYSAPDKKACDLGCGIGDFLPVLASMFRYVTAVDISSKCIAIAKSKFKKFKNISYQTADLSKSDVRLSKVDFTLSVNSMLTPSLIQRNNMFDLTCRCIRPGGHLVLVVPSLESVFFSNYRRIEWNLKSGMSPANAVRAGFKRQTEKDIPRLRQGIVKIDDVETKHYLEEELISLLKSRRMEILEIEKIQYPWNTEFNKPPRWMREPFPWDWLFVANKIY